MGEDRLKVIDFNRVELVGKSLASAGRVEIMIALANDGPMSSAMLARAGFGIVSANSLGISNTSYHCRRLLDAGLAKMSDTRPVRGSIEHFYALTKSGTDLARIVAKLGA